MSDTQTLDGIMKDLVTEFSDQRIKPERKIRRAYGTGFIHGIKMAAEASKMHLRKSRFDAGLDPETGKPMPKESN